MSFEIGFHSTSESDDARLTASKLLAAVREAWTDQSSTCLTDEQNTNLHDVVYKPEEAPKETSERKTSRTKEMFPKEIVTQYATSIEHGEQLTADMTDRIYTLIEDNYRRGIKPVDSLKELCELINNELKQNGSKSYLKLRDFSIKPEIVRTEYDSHKPPRYEEYPGRVQVKVQVVSAATMDTNNSWTFENGEFTTQRIGRRLKKK